MTLGSIASEVSLVAALTLSQAQTPSCILATNSTTAAALTEYKRGRFITAAQLYQQAAVSLKRCIQNHPNELTVESQQRFGELWMYAGEMRLENGYDSTARGPLLQAKELFLDLRNGGTLRGTVLDEVLLDSHQVDSDLARLDYSFFQKRGNVEARGGDFNAAIASWSRAASLDANFNKRCRGEFQRVQIQAAKEAQVRMVTHNVTEAQAAVWFEKRESQLWISNSCNGP